MSEFLFWCEILAVLLLTLNNIGLVSIHAQLPGNDGPIIIDLSDVGYDSTWERFCDPAEIRKDFPTYPEHDLKNIRKIICKLKQSGLINRGSLLAFASYKYCSAMRYSFDDFLDKLVERLSLEEEEKKAILLTPGPANDSSICYSDTMDAFYRTCAGKGNPCIRMFKLLLARACVAPWITTESILMHVKEVCAGRWITDKINWDSVFMTINPREEI